MVQILFGVLMLLTIALNTVAQTLLKLGSGQGLLSFYLLGGIAAYGVSTIFYILVLSKFDLSIAYPVVIGLTVVATTVSGAMLLREKVQLTQWVGIGLMLSGIFAIALGKR